MFDSSIDFKEQMIETRRKQILAGAAQVFAEKGFHKATTKEIAKAAGVSEGTIYNYFDNKRELILALLELWATQSLSDLVIDRPPDNPRDFLITVLQDRFQLLQEHGYFGAPILAEMFTDADLRQAVYDEIVIPMTALLEQYFKSQIEAGILRPVEPLIITRALIGAMLVNATLKLSGLDSRYDAISPDALIERVVSIMLDGVMNSDQPSPPSSSPLRSPVANDQKPVKGS